MATITATADNIVDLLSAVKGAKIVTITTKTIPAMVRTAEDGRINPFAGKNLRKDVSVRKIARVNGVVNWNYTNSVNRQLVREGKTADFTAHPRKWGTRMSGLPFVIHIKDGKVNLYLEMKVERSVEHWYEDDKGNRVNADEVKPFLKPRSVTRQGTDKEVILRDYRIDNIIAIRHEGDTYVITDNLRLTSDIAAIRT